MAVASKAILNLTRPVPIVGEVAIVLLKVAETYGELAGVSSEADAVAAWATRVGREFKTLKSSLNKRGSASCGLSKNLRDEVKEAAECIDALLSVAKKITGARGCCTGSKPARLLKSAMFKAKFEAAQNAVERARVELDRTLAIDTNVTVHDTNDTVHTVEVEVGGLREDVADVKRILAKIDANTNADANERQLQRGLVESVKHQPELLTVAEMVVDGDGAGASAALAEAPVEMRESAAALFAKGMALYQQESWSEAIVALKKCVARDPENSEAWFALGYAYHGQNGKKSCEAEFEPYTRCIALDPKHAVAHINLGLVLKNVRKDYDGAERHYRKAIELDPKHALAHNTLGNLLKTVRNNYDDAEQHYREAIELDPKNAHAHNNLGSLLQTVRKDYIGAERHFRTAIGLDPSGGDYHNNLAFFLMERGDLGQAEKEICEAIKIAPQVAVYHFTYGAILEAKNDIPGAVKLMEEFIRLGGDPRVNGKERLAALRAKLETTQ